MSSWKVIDILSGNSISVTPSWKWNGQEGNKVVINGYLVSLPNLPNTVAEVMAKARLSSTIKDKEISLRNPTIAENGTIYCDVFLNDIDISKYFVDFGKVH